MKVSFLLFVHIGLLYLKMCPVSSFVHLFYSKFGSSKVLKDEKIDVVEDIASCLDV